MPDKSRPETNDASDKPRVSYSEYDVVTNAQPYLEYLLGEGEEDLLGEGEE